MIQLSRCTEREGGEAMKTGDIKVTIKSVSDDPSALHRAQLWLLNLALQLKSTTGEVEDTQHQQDSERRCEDVLQR